MRSRWSELGRIDKGVSALGLGVGIAGILVDAILATVFSSQGSSGFDTAGLVVVIGFVSIPFLVPLVSAIGLLLLPLKD